MVKSESYKTTNILFICLGNICRSPAAEAVMRHLIDLQGLSHCFSVASAAIGPWHVGELPDSRMRRHAARRGYQLNSRGQQFNASYFNRFDYIIVMDEENYCAVTSMARNDEERGKVLRMRDYFNTYKGRHSVPDPYYGSDRDFDIALDLLEDGCQQILQSFIRHRN